MRHPLDEDQVDEQLRAALSKRSLAQLRKAQRREERAEKRKYRRCFWTWPFGHITEGEWSSDRVCLYCGKNT